MAGLNENGFSIKRQDEIIEDLRQNASDIFADLVPAGDEVKTDDSSVIGRLIGVNTPSLVDLWQAVQDVYDAFNLEAAEGIALDNLAQLGGVIRAQATSSSVDLRLTGTYLTVIPRGSLYSSQQTGKSFATVFSLTLNENFINGAKIAVQTVQNSTLYRLSFSKNPDPDSTGTLFIDYTSDSTATETEILNGLASAINTNPDYNSLFFAEVVNGFLQVDALDLSLNYNFLLTNNLRFDEISKTISALCTETGPNEQAPNTIQSISTPTLGLRLVTNPFSAGLGSDLEKDEDLRVRYRSAKSVGSTNTLEALYADLDRLDGVEDTFIFANESDTVNNTYSIPINPHNIYVVVKGGAGQFIGEAIFKNKAAGIGTAGTQAVTVQDANGFNHLIRFQRPVEVPIYISITIEAQPDFEANGLEKIKAALVTYFRENNGLGDDVIFSRLYTPINSIKGHYVNSLFVGTSASPTGTSNILIEDDFIATINLANIIINVV